MNKSQPDYEIFHQWFQQNGGCMRKLAFPSKFGQFGYVGMAASEDIMANQILISIPKKLIISVSMILQTQLGEIIPKYPLISESEDQSSDFNILTLFIIWQKGLGKQSFFYPYLQAITVAETIMNWENSQVEKLRDPYITVQIVQEIRKGFYPVFEQCVKITENHPELFKQKLTWETFQYCEAIVMTRCFGWGLPETMLVPYADFLNHSSSGVHTYSFSRKLQCMDNECYIKKRKQLDLQFFGIDNKKQLPISYARNAREQYVYQKRQILQKKNIQYEQNVRLSPNVTKKLVKEIQLIQFQNDFHSDILASSDSEDNDSQEEKPRSVKEAFLLHYINRMVHTQLQAKFTQPKPTINQEFQEGVQFDWWKEDSNENYFLVVSDKFIGKGNQVFNCYGKRSNRFLLLWYGFSFPQNKYDSIPFRLWDEKVYEKTGQLIFPGYLTEKHLNEGILIGEEKYPHTQLTLEYRFKKQSINYELMGYLRLKIIRKDEVFRQLYKKKKQVSFHEIKNLQIEKMMIKQYDKILRLLLEIYDPYTKREPLLNPEHHIFMSIIQESNKQILQAHCKSVFILKNIINKIKPPLTRERVSEFYNEKYFEEQNSREKKIQNRMKIMDYFRMLQKYCSVSSSPS